MTLVGLAGVGKSTVGRILASRWGWTFVDLDPVVEERADATVERIFATEGEAAFRRMEAEALEEVLSGRRVVLAPGGGAPCRPGAMDRILAAGPAVWLRASPDRLADRLLAAGGRPLAAGRDRAGIAALVREQIAERGVIYGRADHALDVDELAPAEVADAVEELLGREGAA